MTTVATSTLATATIRVADSAGTPRPSYLVRVFNGTNGSGSEWANATTSADGTAIFYLPDSNYGYRVDKAGATSTKVGFVVASPAPVANDQILAYTLATVTVTVADSGGAGRAGYLVRIFNGTNGAGSEWGNATSGADGKATFVLPDGNYGYRVDKAGATGTKIGFAVAPATDRAITYTLAQLTFHVQNGGDAPLSGYLVRIYNGIGGSGSEWGNATTNANGDATFYLMDGGYQYQVQKGTYNSGRQATGGFTVPLARRAHCCSRCREPVKHRCGRRVLCKNGIRLARCYAASREYSWMRPPSTSRRCRGPWGDASARDRAALVEALN